MVRSFDSMPPVLWGGGTPPSAILPEADETRPPGGMCHGAAGYWVSTLLSTSSNPDWPWASAPSMSPSKMARWNIGPHGPVLEYRAWNATVLGAYPRAAASRASLGSRRC